MTGFAPDYLIFVFTSALGVLFLVAAYQRLNGLLLLGRRTTLVVGALLLTSAFIWFFVSEPRNAPDTRSGLNGNEQALLFVLGSGAALALLLLISSLKNWSMAISSEAIGVDALREASFLRLILRRLRDLWNSWNVRTKQRSSG